MVVLLSAFQVACPSYLEKQSFGIIGGSSTEGLIGNVNHNHCNLAMTIVRTLTHADTISGLVVIL